MAASTYPLMRASDFGVTVHPRAHAHVFPALGAYVGGDIVSGLLASGMTRDKRLRLFIDVGTNCEIALGNVERLLTTAAPAGPAFEAAQIRCGMRAADGAIETIAHQATTSSRLGVIGDATPVGICGSGLVDAVARARQVRACSTPRGASSPTRRPPRCTPCWPSAWSRSTASASSCSPGRASRAIPRARSTCRSATCASCSSRRPRSRPAGRCSWRSSASRWPTSSRCCSRARSGRTSRPPPRCASGSCPSSRCRASSRPATSRARARR